MQSDELTGYNQKDIRAFNRMSVFRIIFESPAISRAEIARLTGLNPATVTHITKELIEQGWIEQTDRERVETSFGRPRSALQVKADAGYVLSVSIERFGMEVAITDLCFNHLLCRSLQPAQTEGIYADYLTVAESLAFLEQVFVDSGLSRSQVLGIGIAAPGPIDAAEGSLLNVPNFPGWSGLPIRQILSQRLGMPVQIARDANAYALAEKWFGVAQDLDKFLYVVAATGIGGSLVLNGDIYRGANHVAGEFGHVTVDPRGGRCDCGNIGCLELYASPQNVARRVAAALESGRTSCISDLVDGQHSLITFEHVVEAALLGDDLCLLIIREAIDFLLTALVTTINIVDPEAVVFGGKLALLEPFLDAEVQSELQQRIFANPARHIPFLFGALAERTPLLGAYALVLRELFQNANSKSRF